VLSCPSVRAFREISPDNPGLTLSRPHCDERDKSSVTPQGSASGLIGKADSPEFQPASFLHKLIHGPHMIGSGIED